MSYGSHGMGLFKKAVGGAILAKFINLERLPWYRRLTPRQRTAAGFIFSLTPLGRLSFGGLALLAARRLFARPREA
jgi:hypothetical protein